VYTKTYTIYAWKQATRIRFYRIIGSAEPDMKRRRNGLIAFTA